MTNADPIDSGTRTHEILRCWLRPKEAGPMSESETLTLVADQGIEGDHTFGRMRHVTLIFEDAWKAAASEIGMEVDPSGRRANVLVKGVGGLEWVGRKARLGEALLHIRGETKPCPVMEKAAVGMQKALAPDGRAGVWARVIEGGVIRRGDLLRIEGT